jgi:thymidylate synthase (FAD)
MKIERNRNYRIEDVLGVEIPVLDHGMIRVIDYMGDDAAVVQAARVSYGKGTKTPSDDRSLIRYLMRNRHTSPFEMCEIKLHLKMPIFVARQWVRHRTASLNEVSGRYSLVKEEFYVPSGPALAPQSSSNKQGREGGYSNSDRAILETVMATSATEAFEVYKSLLVESGYNLTRELARCVLPLSTYTEFYWKIDVHNLLHFLKLRDDPHAQHEIQVYAREIARIMDIWMPMTMEAWRDYVQDAVTLSRSEMEVIRSVVPDDLWTRLYEAFENSERFGRTEALEAVHKLHAIRGAES